MLEGSPRWFQRVFFGLLVWGLGLVAGSCEQLGREGAGTSVRQADALRGPVRSVTVTQAELMKKDGQWDIRQQRTLHTASYDRQGRKTEQLVYAEDGVEQLRLRFRYDESGRRTETLHFDSHERLTARQVSSYDSAGRLSQSLSYGPDQELTARTVFSYDAAGNQVASQQVSPTGQILTRTVSSYDEGGNLVQQQWYAAAPTPVRTRTASYDYLGTLASDSVYDYAADGSLSQRTDVRYNHRGQPQTEVTYRRNGRFKRERSFRYQSDAFGNWTLQTIQTRILVGQAPSFEPPRVISRTLDYYGRQPPPTASRPQ